LNFVDLINSKNIWDEFYLDFNFHGFPDNYLLFLYDFVKIN
jgi:hypothetical protein